MATALKIKARAKTATLEERLAESLGQAVAFRKGDTSKGDRERVTVPEIEIDVREIRSELKLSQEQFAAKFGFPVATVRNWEQGRREPEGPAKFLLRLIRRYPKLVAKELESSK
jgi:putative transcriptional regulator